MLTNEQIIAGCLKNERKSQKALFEMFSSKMYGYCLRYTRNTAEAQDVLQEGFIKVFEKINTLKDARTLEGWMTRIFINMALSRYRKERSGPEWVEVSGAEMITEEEETEQNMDDLTPETVLEMMKQIPENYRTVLNLYAIDGLSHKEISSLLDTTESNSKSMLSRARKMMRDLLEQRTKTK